MSEELLSGVHADVLNLALVLALSFFIGLEREDHKQRDAAYAFGGVRTFPLIGLVSYGLSLISGAQLVPWTLGLALIGGFMLLSYSHKLAGSPPAGLTTEMSALVTYIIGGLVQHQSYWLATSIAVVGVLLLELKIGLEGLTRFVASSEVVTLAKFLVLAAVILPVVPDEELTRFHINPFKTWLVVVAVCGISFASYVLQRIIKKRGGVMLSAVLGGAYSSTVTTIALARQAKDEGRPNLFAGSILTASAVMYLRLVVLLGVFNLELAERLAPAFAGLGLLGGGCGWFVSRRKDGTEPSTWKPQEAKNPLELGAAFLFAFLFVGVLVLTGLAREHLGKAGIFSLAAIMGVTDVDPFILGLAQRTSSAAPIGLAAPAIVIAAASNNVVKAIYAFSFTDRATGLRSLVLLLLLATLGLLPLIWV